MMMVMMMRIIFIARLQIWGVEGLESEHGFRVSKVPFLP